jgi:integrase
MPKPRDAKLESATARLRLPIRPKPYSGPSLARGVRLLYRRNRTAGTWVVKASDGRGAYWTKAFAVADDYDPADGKSVLTFFQAQTVAKALARGTADAPDAKPVVTVADAVDAYERDLQSRAADPDNAKRARLHLTSTLAAKPVALLTAQDLRHWRDVLMAKGMEPPTFNRTRAGLRAALELAAALDDRIKNRDVFRVGLKGLPGANNARRVVLPDADVRRIVEGAYAESEDFGLLVRLLAETGARVSQAARLRCADLQADRADPRVLMPTSYKGKGKKERQHIPVPITPGFAALLQDARGDRPADAVLLLKRDGTRWQEDHSGDHIAIFRAAVIRAGLDATITSYALRHSSICRALLKGVPITVVARLHDTSSKEIEAHYAAYIADFSDAIQRRALLQMPMPDAENIVALAGRP